MFPLPHSNIDQKSPDTLGNLSFAPQASSIARDLALNQFFQVTNNDNAAFWEMYLVSWNTGVMDRDFEKFFRYARNAQGLNHYYENIRQASNDLMVGKKIEQLVRSASLQIINHTKESMVAARIKNNVPMMLVELSWSTDVIDVRLSGDQSHTNAFKAAFANLLPGNGIHLNQIVGCDQYGAILTSHRIFPEAHRTAKAYYYPWLEENGWTLESLFEDYGKDDQAVLLLIGPRGTGKSTFSRSLLFALRRDDNYTVTNEAVLDSDKFFLWFQKENPSGTLLIEDADTFVMSRESGNKSMSALLNMADGIVRTPLKMIFSTNLSSLKQVDSALVRPGRTYKVLEFRELTAAEATRIRELDDLPPVYFDPKCTYTLAEVLNYKSEADLQSRAIPSVGFGRR